MAGTFATDSADHFEDSMLFTALNYMAFGTEIALLATSRPGFTDMAEQFRTFCLDQTSYANIRMDGRGI